jgi:hypothetical protein
MIPYIDRQINPDHERKTGKTGKRHAFFMIPNTFLHGFVWLLRLFAM